MKLDNFNLRFEIGKDRFLLVTNNKKGVRVVVINENGDEMGSVSVVKNKRHITVWTYAQDGRVIEIPLLNG